MDNIYLLSTPDLLARVRALRIYAGINYQKAKEKAQPILAEINRRGKIIAARKGCAYRNIGFAGFRITL